MSYNQSVRRQMHATQETTRQQVELIASRIADKLQRLIAAAGEQGAVVPSLIGNIVNAVGNVLNDVANVDFLDDATEPMVRVMDDVQTVLDNITNLIPAVIVGFEMTSIENVQISTGQQQASAQQLIEARRSVIQAQADTRALLHEAARRLHERLEGVRNNLG